MNNKIQRFDFRGASLRTLTDEAGEPWFVAKDVCDILEISNVTMALQKLDDDERSKFNLGRQGETNIVNEAGLYVLVLGSRKPEAHEFKRWVTHEVLPQIRRTGGYIHTTNTDSDEDILAKAVLVAQKTIERKNQQLQAKDAQIKELATVPSREVLLARLLGSLQSSIAGFVRVLDAIAKKNSEETAAAPEA